MNWIMLWIALVVLGIISVFIGLKKGRTAEPYDSIIWIISGDFLIVLGAAPLIAKTLDL